MSFTTACGAAQAPSFLRADIGAQATNAARPIAMGEAVGQVRFELDELEQAVELLRERLNVVLRPAEPSKVDAPLHEPTSAAAELVHITRGHATRILRARFDLRELISRLDI